MLATLSRSMLRLTRWVQCRCVAALQALTSGLVTAREAWSRQTGATIQDDVPASADQCTAQAPSPRIGVTGPRSVAGQGTLHVLPAPHTGSTGPRTAAASACLLIQPTSSRTVPRYRRTPPARYARDQLRRHQAQISQRSEVIARRMWAIRPDWDMLTLAIYGVGDNPLHPVVGAAVRLHIAVLVKKFPYQCSLERGKKVEQGGLHVHLLVPRGTPVPGFFWTATPDGVLVISKILHAQPVKETLDDLERVLRYMRKPALAGAQEFRLSGPQHPAYLHAERLLDEAQGISETLGLSGSLRTVWYGNMPRLPPVGDQPPCTPACLAPAPGGQDVAPDPGAAGAVSAPGCAPAPRPASHAWTGLDPIRIVGDAAAAAATLPFPSVARSLGLLRTTIARIAIVCRAVCRSWSRG